MAISLREYCEEYLDLCIDLMNEQEIDEVKVTYNLFLKDTEQEIEARKKALDKARESRKLAKFYGGKALTGSAKQKKWAEDIREIYLKSDALTDEQKIELVTCGGFTDTAKFWIENRNVEASKMTARNIVAQYRVLQKLEEEYSDICDRTRSVGARDRIREKIESYINKCDFKFESCC